ncbi:hypothetical protein SLEP1_g53353 [Rubroshorea leprosula]|uniref:Uncharacterized protein n=1 Tax=Rubroshorea leprosula TaxID=152421 RepID=A0AAV5MBZ6_9ROSI|nr:hypothetical protein SLEP1_g53353 [Rubroshorea leprosula]
MGTRFDFRMDLILVLRGNTVGRVTERVAKGDCP